MSTRIVDAGPMPLIAPTRTAARVTPVPGQPFRSIMQAGAQAVVDSAETAVLRLPGGPVLAAAFRAEPPGLGTTSSPLAASRAAEGSGGTTSDAEGPLPSTAAAGGSADALTGNTEQNMYYLQLQQQISEESREYTTLSNVLRARHDMIKHTIDNIR